MNAFRVDGATMNGQERRIFCQYPDVRARNKRRRETAHRSIAKNKPFIIGEANFTLERGVNKALTGQLYCNKISIQEVGMNGVFVISGTRKPLMPTNPARARKLLKSGKAAVIRQFPFTIILKERSDSEFNPYD